MMSATRPRVLVVDDDPDLLKLLSIRLRAAGYDVKSAESGEAALAQLSLSRPQAVVTDLRMGGMDGMSLFEAIHRDNPALPVLDVDSPRHHSRRGDRDPARHLRRS